MNRTFARRTMGGILAAVGWIGVWASGGPTSQADQGVPASASATPPVEPGRKGRYYNLLKTLPVPSDRAAYGDFMDYGYYPATSYGGCSDLPPGYWVYLYPNWYIFKDAKRETKQPWCPEQATGVPDTPNAGDLGTAWASRTSDDQEEWLDLTYPYAVEPLALLVYESFNPGALDRVCVFDASGDEVPAWTGADPTPPDRPKGVSVIPFQTRDKVSRVRIYLNSREIRGWNEIDAVGLLDSSGTTHWASGASASSTWAQR